MNRFEIGFLQKPKFSSYAELMEDSGFNNVWLPDESPSPPYTYFFYEQNKFIGVIIRRF